MNYATLVALLQDYTQNSSTEFVAAIPDIVKLAEDRIYQSVQIPALKRNATSNFVQGNKYLAAPTDFLSVYSMAAKSASGVYSYLLEKEVGYINEAFPNPAATGVPRYYALFNDATFVVAPTPNAFFEVELHYFYEPPSIVDTGTSWLGDNTESVLFYGALCEAYTYMKGDADLVTLYRQRYDEALARLKNLGEGMDKRDNFRLDMPRIAPT
jgi:hypothetical protein